MKRLSIRLEKEPPVRFESAVISARFRFYGSWWTGSPSKPRNGVYSRLPACSEAKKGHDRVRTRDIVLRAYDVQGKRTLR